jgi:acyl-CoA thioesterase FadM
MKSKISPRISKSHISVSSRGKDTKVTYFAPLHPNDRKRIGTELTIKVGKASITLDGKGRRALESVLNEVAYQEAYG